MQRLSRLNQTKLWLCLWGSSLLAILNCPMAAAAQDLTQSHPGDGLQLNASLRQKPSSETGTTLQREGLQQPGSQQTSDSSQDSAAGEKMTFFLARLDVDPSTILSPTDIRSVASGYEGRLVTLQEITEAVDKLNDLYCRKPAYIARALLLPQTIDKGVVHIVLVESRIGSVRFANTLPQTEQSYVLERLKVQAGSLVNLDQLEANLIRFNKTNQTQLSAALRRGESFGTTDILLQASDAPSASVVLYSDNGGTETSGEYRLGVDTSWHHLFTREDELAVNVSHSRGNTGGSVAYELPVGTDGTRLGVSYSKNQNDVVSGVFQSLQIRGHSSDLALTLNRPLVTTATDKTTQYFELHEKKADTYLLGDAILAYTARSFTTGWSSQKNDSNGLVYHRFDVTRGYTMDTSDGSADSRTYFTKANLSWVRQLPLDEQHGWLFRVSGQWNFQPSVHLPSTDVFSLGGFSSVRGYKEGELSGDRGYFISTEYHFPLASWEGVLFLDHGGVFSYDVSSITNSRDCYMTSLGVGVIASFGKNVAAQVFWGKPLGGGKYAGSGRFHFLLQYRYF